MAQRPSNDFIFGYFFARRFAKPWKGRERTRPKMPSTPWRVAAVCCIATGALLAWLIFRGSDAVVIRTIFGGVVGLVVGMILVETIWERRVAAREPGGPIGPRR